MSFTIDVHHHILPDVFWRATNDAHNHGNGTTGRPMRSTTVWIAPWARAARVEPSKPATMKGRSLSRRPTRHLNRRSTTPRLDVQPVGARPGNGIRAER